MTTDLTLRVPFRRSQTILEAPAHPAGRGQENSRGRFSCDAINPGNRAATQISVNCDPYDGRTQKKSCIAGSRHISSWDGCGAGVGRGQVRTGTVQYQHPMGRVHRKRQMRIKIGRLLCWCTPAPEQLRAAMAEFIELYGRDPEAKGRSKNSRHSTNDFSTIWPRKTIEQPVNPRSETVACQMASTTLLWLRNLHIFHNSTSRQCRAIHAAAARASHG